MRKLYSLIVWLCDKPRCFSKQRFALHRTEKEKDFLQANYPLRPPDTGGHTEKHSISACIRWIIAPKCRKLTAVINSVLVALYQQLMNLLNGIKRVIQFNWSGAFKNDSAYKCELRTKICM